MSGLQLHRAKASSSPAQRGMSTSELEGSYERLAMLRTVRAVTVLITTDRCICNDWLFPGTVVAYLCRWICVDCLRGRAKCTTRIGGTSPDLFRPCTIAAWTKMDLDSTHIELKNKGEKEIIRTLLEIQLGPTDCDRLTRHTNCPQDAKLHRQYTPVMGGPSGVISRNMVAGKPIAMYFGKM